jgi:hypothetical protein
MLAASGTNYSRNFATLPRQSPALPEIAELSIISGWSKSFLLAIGFAYSAAAPAQPLTERTIELDEQTVHYSIRTFPAGANRVDLDARLEPVSALDTAKLLNRHLSSGAVEEAALLSNSPRRRFEVLSDYKSGVGEEGFKQVFSEYFDPGNSVVAEISLGNHSVLVWHLRKYSRYAGQYYVRVEGKVLIDDVPSEARTTLRKLLEAFRAGKLPLPAPSN